MPFEGLPERWFTGNGLRTSVDHFIPDALFFRPMRDQPPAHQYKLTFPALGFPNNRNIPAWSHVVAGEVERGLREAEMALNICIDFADVTSAHGRVGVILVYWGIMGDEGRGYQTGWMNGYQRRAFLFSLGGTGYGG